MPENGAYVTLWLLVIWTALMILLALGKLQTVPFSAASTFLVLMMAFFWFGPNITEFTISKVGSFKTNAEQATKYFDEIKSIRAKIETEYQTINNAVESLNTEISVARAETKQTQEAVQRVGQEAANEGVRAGQAEERLASEQAKWNDRIGRLEQEVEELRTGHTIAPIVPPIKSAATEARYILTDDARRVIHETTMPGAIVSIIPFMPNLEQFASDLGAAFEAVPGVQVAVGHGNTIINGQTGLIVQYDHNNPVSASVFNALIKAGLNPIAGAPVTESSIVSIKVAPR